MAKLKYIIDVAEDGRLLSVCKIGVKRAAYLAIKDPAASDAMKAWAKRVLGEPNMPGRADWYASRVLEGALCENAQLLAFVDAAEATGMPFKDVDIPVSDAQFMAIVQPWVQLFAAQGI